MISVLMSSKTTFLPILSAKASRWFAMASLTSSLLFLLTVTAALTVNFTGSGFPTTRFTTSSLIAATTFVDRQLLLLLLVCSMETRAGEAKQSLLCLPRSRNELGAGAKDDLSSWERPVISLQTAILFLDLSPLLFKEF